MCACEYVVCVCMSVVCIVCVVSECAFECVMCVRAHVWVCMHACVYVCMRVSVCVCVCVGSVPLYLLFLSCLSR